MVQSPVPCATAGLATAANAKASHQRELILMDSLLRGRVTVRWPCSAVARRARLFTDGPSSVAGKERSVITAAHAAGGKSIAAQRLASGSKLLTGYNLTTPLVASRPGFSTPEHREPGIMMQAHGVQSFAPRQTSRKPSIHLAVRPQRNRTVAFFTVCQIPQRSGTDTRAQAKTTNAQLEEEGFGDVSLTATESLLGVRGAPVGSKEYSQSVIIMQAAITRSGLLAGPNRTDLSGHPRSCGSAHRPA
jgi:hypothetical protein